MDIKEKAKEIFDSTKEPIFEMACDLLLILYQCFNFNIITYFY